MKKSTLNTIKAGKEQEIITALNDLRNTGNIDSIPALLQLLATTDSELVYNGVISLLNDLRIEGAEEIFLQALEDPAFEKEREVLVSFFWQSHLDPSKHISFFVNYALKSEYMVAFECLTVLESITDFQHLDDEEVLSNIQTLNEAISRKHEHTRILIPMVEVLNTMLIGQ